MGGKNADSSSLLIKVTEDELEGLETKEELAMTEEEVLEKAFEQFYKTAPVINSQKKNARVKSGDSKITTNEITSRGTDESQEVILSPNNFQSSNEKALQLKLVNKADEESLNKQLREEGLGEQTKNLNDEVRINHL